MSLDTLHSYSYYIGPEGMIVYARGIPVLRVSLMHLMRDLGRAAGEAESRKEESLSC